MQKNIGSKLALYPMPLLVIGSIVENRVNWVLVGDTIGNCLRLDKEEK